MLSEKPRSTLSETRKVTKSTMEKKRRARINNSLTELKTILSGMVANKSERFDKMEKADILEMTVNCVRQLQRHSSSVDKVSSTNSTDQDYVSGMHTCANEVMKFLANTNFGNTDPDVKAKLLDHLANKLTFSTSPVRDNAPVIKPKTVSPMRSSSYSSIESTVSSTVSGSPGGDVNNNKSEQGHKPSLPEATPIPTSTSIQIPQRVETAQISPVPCLTPPMKPVATNEAIQPVFHMSPTSGVPTVPVTILVPANICSSNLGTTYIPLAIPGHSPQLIRQPENFKNPLLIKQPDSAQTAQLTKQPDTMESYSSHGAQHNSSPQVSPVLTIPQIQTSHEMPSLMFQNINGQGVYVYHSPKAFQSEPVQISPHQNFGHPPEQQIVTQHNNISHSKELATNNALNNIHQSAEHRQTQISDGKTESRQVDHRISKNVVETVHEPVRQPVPLLPKKRPIIDHFPDDNNVKCDHSGPVWRPW